MGQGEGVKAIGSVANLLSDTGSWRPLDSERYRPPSHHPNAAKEGGGGEVSSGGLGLKKKKIILGAAQRC